MRRSRVKKSLNSNKNDKRIEECDVTGTHLTCHLLDVDLFND